MVLSLYFIGLIVHPLWERLSILFLECLLLLEQKGVGHTPTRAEGSGPYPVLPRSLGRKWGSTQGPDWRGGGHGFVLFVPQTGVCLPSYTDH